MDAGVSISVSVSM